MLTPAFTSLGAPSTKSLASFNPKPVIALTSLITLIFLSPADERTIVNSSFSSAGAAPAAAGAAATAAAAVTAAAATAAAAADASAAADATAAAALVFLFYPNLAGHMMSCHTL